MTTNETTIQSQACEACATGYHERCENRTEHRQLASTTQLGCAPTASYCCCHGTGTLHRHADGTEHSHEIGNLVETQHEHVPYSAVGPRRSDGTGPVVWSDDLGLIFSADDRAALIAEYTR